MKDKVTAKSKLLRLFLLCAVFLIACGDNTWSPTTPHDSELTSLAKVKASYNSDLLLVRKRQDAENGVSKAVIGILGGVLVHAEHRVEVPAGVLDEPAELTFSMPVSDTLMFDFGPDGTEFKAPVKLILSYDHALTGGLDEELFSIAVWNPNTNIWESIPTTVDTERNEVQGRTTHFSRYAISK